MSNLLLIWYDAIQGKPLAEGQTAFIFKQLASSKLETAVLAEAILSIVDNAHQAACRKKLLRSCGSQTCGKEDNLKAILLLVLERFPVADYANKKLVLKFIFRCARGSFIPARVNAMRVLRRLAKCGDRKAIQTLNKSINDSDHYVKEAAKVAIRLSGSKCKRGPTPI